MVQIISIIVPKESFADHYTQPSRKALAELEVDFKGVGEVVEELKQNGEDIRLADAVVELLKFQGLKPFNGLIISDSETHHVVRFRASRKKGNQWVSIVRRSIGVGVHTGYIDIATATSMPGLPRDKATAAKRKGQFFRDDRLTDNAIYEAVDNVSHLTFDYLVMLMVGSLISGVGLITDSAVTVVASMLVSPLMGPILCIAFGLTVSDSTMMCRGLRNEVIGVGLCFAMGLLFGFVTGPFYGEDGANKQLGMNVSEENLLVSSEIDSRGKLSALLPGFFVAAPSGFGAAMAINTDGANALVGVAISAALLPPLVNCGFCIAFAAFAYNNVQAWVVKGLYSGLLFLLNLVCIIIFASLAMRIYRIKPLQTRQAFWESLRIQSPPRRRNRSSKAVSLAGSGEYVEMDENVGERPRNSMALTPDVASGRRNSLPNLFGATSSIRHLQAAGPPSGGPLTRMESSASISGGSNSNTITRSSSLMDPATMRQEFEKMEKKKLFDQQTPKQKPAIQKFRSHSMDADTGLL